MFGLGRHRARHEVNTVLSRLQIRAENATQSPGHPQMPGLFPFGMAQSDRSAQSE